METFLDEYLNLEALEYVFKYHSLLNEWNIHFCAFIYKSSPPIVGYVIQTFLKFEKKNNIQRTRLLDRNANISEAEV